MLNNPLGSLTDEEGKPTATFWLLVAVVVVGIILMIQALGHEAASDMLATPAVLPQENHATPETKPVPMKKPAAKSAAPEASAGS